METRILLQKILSHLAKPGKNRSLMCENQQQCISQLSSGEQEDELLEKQLSKVKIDCNEEVFPNDPDDDLSTDDTDLLEMQPVATESMPKRRVSLDKLRIIGDMHSIRPRSIDSVRSITDDESFDSAL